MPAKKPKPVKAKPKPSDALPPEQHEAAFTDALKRSLALPKGAWPKPKGKAGK